MARNITITFDDGSTHVYQNAPDDVTPNQVSQRAKQEFGKTVTGVDGGNKPSIMDTVKQQAGNLAAGAVRGAGSIGATILSPIDAAARAVNGGQPISVGGYDIAGQDRRAGMDAALSSMGADTNSLAFQGAKFGTEVVGTLGAGGATANALTRFAPRIAAAAPGVVEAIRTAGMTGGNVLARTAGGAINGAVSAGLVDPNNALAGATIGGALPGAAQIAGKVGNVIGEGVSDLTSSASKRLMQSAIKPTIAQLKSGDAATAVQTLLDKGINPTAGGVDKLRSLIDAKNAEIAGEIASSGATIDKSNVLNALSGVRQRFGNQVSPTSDLNAIRGVADDFLAHPNLPGSTIPVQAAQDLKQGTYQALRGKYGQLGSAETEAQKALARGLKDEIATAVPAVGPMNAEESRLLTTLSVAERRALMEMNKNPMGLAALAHNPTSWAMFMADKSALFKSLAARAVNSLPGVAGSAQNALANPAAQQLVYQAAPAALAGR